MHAPGNTKISHRDFLELSAKAYYRRALEAAIVDNDLSRRRELERAGWKSFESVADWAARGCPAM